MHQEAWKHFVRQLNQYEPLDVVLPRSWIACHQKYIKKSVSCKLTA